MKQAKNMIQQLKEKVRAGEKGELEEDKMENIKHTATCPVICDNCDSKVSISFIWYVVCGRAGEDVVLCEDCFKLREKVLQGGKK